MTTLCFLLLATYLSLGLFCICKAAPWLIEEINAGENTHWEWFRLIFLCLLFGPLVLLAISVTKLWNWLER